MNKRMPPKIYSIPFHYSGLSSKMNMSHFSNTDYSPPPYHAPMPSHRLSSPRSQPSNQITPDTGAEAALRGGSSPESSNLGQHRPGDDAIFQLKLLPRFAAPTLTVKALENTFFKSNDIFGLLIIISS